MLKEAGKNFLGLHKIFGMFRGGTSGGEKGGCSGLGEEQM